MKAVSIKATKTITHVIIEDDMYSSVDISKLLKTNDVAKLTGITPKALARRRQRGLGPPWIRPPGMTRIYYDPRDVAAWINAGRREPTSER